MQEVQETCVQSLGWEDPLEKQMAAHSSILAWKIPWTEESVQLTVHGDAESEMTEHTRTVGDQFQDNNHMRALVVLLLTGESSEESIFLITSLTRNPQETLQQRHSAKSMPQTRDNTYL